MNKEKRAYTTHTAPAANSQPAPTTTSLPSSSRPGSLLRRIASAPQPRASAGLPADRLLRMTFRKRWLP
ncbi:hypothetical protein SCLCIDRAFT_1224557 [Scleroderma citrinum Foug A]|uniref:Uncharacterized protein n=1 Tax=Scleroderma citrinum Foug A TaxID=1036808 RepID=A0A0C2YNW9_9AGAM|nr:hypothetical protein SCLCIDRAFT_1224557 [Scleroderma citrinum Foug A]